MNFKEWLLLTEKTIIKDQEFRDPFPALQHIQKTHPNPENLAVTFTKIDKVGLNPKNRFETPIGIYLYPLDYVIQKQMNVPFAGNYPHINVCEFTRPEKILHMTSDVSNQKGMELLNVFPKEQVDKAIKNLDKYKIRSNYSKLWLMTKIISDDKTTQWNINFRKCGIDGFVDHGTGTIHPNEPTQCVVFASNALKLLHSIDNSMYYKTKDKSNDDDDDYIIRKDKYEIEKMSDEQIIGLLKSRRNLNIKSLIDSATDKNKVIELIVKYKSIIFAGDVFDLLNAATEKNKIAEIIIKKKSELDHDSVRFLINFATDTEKIAELIIKKKPELSGDNVAYLLLKANNKDKMAELLQKETDNISKLDDNSVSFLLVYATNKEQMAKVLGTDNISKLSDNNVYRLFDNDLVTDKKQMAKILNQYHAKKTPKIQELISKYISGLFKRIFNSVKNYISPIRSIDRFW